MVLDVNTHVGDDLDASTNSYSYGFHLFEVHKMTAWSLLVVVCILIGLAAALRKYDKLRMRKYKQKTLLSLSWDGEETNTADGYLRPNHPDGNARGSNLGRASSPLVYAK
jgi:hypothetical protein